MLEIIGNVLLYIVLAYIVFLLLFAIYFIVNMKRIRYGNCSEQTKLRFIRIVVFVVLGFFRVKVVNIKGLENLPKEDGYLIVSNHQSNLDGFVIQKINKVLGYIGKVELTKVPLVNDFFFWTNGLFLDRNDIRQSIKIINEAAKNVAEGKNMIIFPEGTRSKDGKLIEFKAGSLKIATKVNAPIVPITLNHLQDIKHRFPFRSTKVNFVIGQPFYSSDYEGVDANVLIEEVKNRIQSNLEV